MKIRTGFVSNSSSSSFAVLGFVVDNEIKEKVKRIALKDEEVETEEYLCCSKCDFEASSDDVKFCEKCGEKMETKTREIELDVYDLFDAVGMSCYCTSDYNNEYVTGFNIETRSAKQISQLNDKLVEMLGDQGFTVISGEYAC